jgi:hypothetical protein
MEMRLAFSRLFWLYDVSTTDGAKDWVTEGQMKASRSTTNDEGTFGCLILTLFAEYGRL